MKKSYLLLFIFVVWYQVDGIAQLILPYDNIITILDNLNARPPEKSEFDGVEGSPYLNDQFTASYVVYPNGDTIKNLAMRYNIYNNRVEYYQENQVMILLENAPVDHLMIGNDVIVFRSPSPYSKVPPGYFILVTRGKASLLAKHSIKFQEQVAAGPIVQPRAAQLFRQPVKYYVDIREGKFARITSVKKLIETLGTHKDELTKYAKQEKISAKDRGDLAQLISYYNGL